MTGATSDITAFNLIIIFELSPHLSEELNRNQQAFVLSLYDKLSGINQDFYIVTMKTEGVQGLREEIKIIQLAVSMEIWRK